MMRLAVVWHLVAITPLDKRSNDLSTGESLIERD